MEALAHKKVQQGLDHHRRVLIVHEIDVRACSSAQGHIVEIAVEDWSTTVWPLKTISGAVDYGEVLGRGHSLSVAPNPSVVEASEAPLYD